MLKKVARQLRSARRGREKEFGKGEKKYEEYNCLEGISRRLAKRVPIASGSTTKVLLDPES